MYNKIYSFGSGFPTIAVYDTKLYAHFHSTEAVFDGKEGEKEGLREENEELQKKNVQLGDELSDIQSNAEVELAAALQELNCQHERVVSKLNKKVAGLKSGISRKTGASRQLLSITASWFYLTSASIVAPH